MGRVLLIIGPDLGFCHRAALAFGLTPPHIENFRNVTRVIQLRGLSAGTPFITFDRQHWGDWPGGYELDAAVETLQRAGRLRLAQEDDIRAHMSFADVPFRTQSGAVLREIAAKYAEGRF